MIDLEQMRDDLWAHTGTDEDDLSVDDANLLLNRSYWQLIDQFHFREKEVSATFPTIAGTRLYNMPDPFDALRLLSILDPDTNRHVPLLRMSITDYETRYSEEASEQALPTHYVREGCAARLWPTPDAEYTIGIKYWTTLADLADTTNAIAPIPQSWHEIIMLGGVWRTFIKLGDYVRGNGARGHQKALVDSQVPTEAKEEYDSPFSGVSIPGRTGDL